MKYKVFYYTVFTNLSQEYVGRSAKDRIGRIFGGRPGIWLSGKFKYKSLRGRRWHGCAPAFVWLGPHCKYELAAFHQLIAV